MKIGIENIKTVYWKLEALAFNLHNKEDEALEICAEHTDSYKFTNTHHKAKQEVEYLALNKNYSLLKSYYKKYKYRLDDIKETCSKYDNKFLRTQVNIHLIPTLEVFDEIKEHVTLDELKNQTKTLDNSQPHHDPAPEVDPVNTKADVLHPKLKEYGFFEIEKVKELNPEKQSKLVKLIANNSLPYQMAMLDFLNFIEHLKKNHFTTQTKTDQELSKILGTNERAVKGNRLVLNEISKEDKNRYTSHQYTDKVQSDYNNL